MSTVTTTNPIDTKTLPDARLAANVAAARSGAEELAAFQTYAQDRCVELAESGVTNDCPAHCDVLLTDDEAASGRAALARVKQHRAQHK